MKLAYYRQSPSQLADAAWLHARATARLAFVAAQIRLLGFQHYLRHVQPVSSAAPAVPPAIARASRYARVIDRASRCPLLPAHCLERSATLHLWLRREGLPSELRIGVRRQGQRIAAHAWVELGGVPVNDQPAALTPFTPLFSRRAAVRPTESRP